MRYFARLLPRLLVASLLVSSSAMLSATGNEGDRPFQIHQTFPLRYPDGAAQSEGPMGLVEVALQVDADGKLADFLILRATKEIFADAVERALGLWSYEAAVRDGEAVASRGLLEVRFQPDKDVVAQTPSGHLRARLDTIQGPQAADRVVAPQDLDAPLKPLTTASPQKGWAAEPTAVTLDFYIDGEGRVRLPAVVEAQYEELAEAALEAIREWRFTPPTLHRRPVLTQARQVFVFKPTAVADATR